MKIVNNHEEYLSNNLNNFNKISRENMSYHNYKSYKKQGFFLFLENTTLGMPQGWS